MDKNLQNIEDLFKKGLEGNEESPSEKVWNSIDQSLEKDNNLRFKKKYYSLKRATAILVVVLALLSIYVLRNESQKQSAGKNKNKNVVTSEPALKNGTTESPESPSEKIKEAPVKTPAERKAPSNENLNPGNKTRIDNADSQQLSKSANNLQLETAIVSNAPAINNTKKQLPETNKSSEEAIHENVGKVENNPPSTSKENNEVAEEPRNQLIATQPVTFDASKIFSFNAKENLKDITSVSSYTSPVRTVNRTPIHLPEPRRFFATVFYSPNVPFSHLRDEDRSYGNTYSRELERNERGSYSYSFGVLVDYRLNNQWALESGLSLSTIKMNMEPEKIFAERDNQGKVKYQINTSSGKGYVLPSFSNNPQIGDSLFTRKINHSLQYTGIPLVAKYYFNDKRLSVNLLAGVSTNILSHGKISTDVEKGNESEHEKTHEIHGLKPVYFSGLAGLGLNYTIYRNVSLTFSPTINFAIEPINKNVPVNSYPGTVNFQIGLQKNF